MISFEVGDLVRSVTVIPDGLSRIPSGTTGIIDELLSTGCVLVLFEIGINRVTLVATYAHEIELVEREVLVQS